MATRKLERVPRGGHTHHVGRTLEWLRKHGFLCAKTEKRALMPRPDCPPGMAYIGPSQDLFGVADVVAIPPAAYLGRRGAWFLQICAHGGAAAHRKKALLATVDNIPVLRALEAAGNRFLVVKYRLGRTIPKDATRAGRLIWERAVEEYLADGSVFVDWVEADFALLGACFVAKKVRAVATSGEAVLSSLL